MQKQNSLGKFVVGSLVRIDKAENPAYIGKWVYVVRDNGTTLDLSIPPMETEIITLSHEDVYAVYLDEEYVKSSR